MARVVLTKHPRDSSAALGHLAKCGNWGLSSANAERDLHRFASKYLHLELEKYYAPIRVCDSDGSEKIMQLPMFPLHEYLYAISVHGGRELFEKCCTGPEGLPALQRFWAHVQHMP
eukprot:9152604-Alexandrium_andersonii.AAC.1